MSYQALYRKYRLSTFEDMVGQDHISSTIKNAIKQEKISHAYLFTGPRGTGKTSIAKLVARAVNCVGDDVLCGTCEICQGILNNQISDIIEIDAASNNGVDEIRDIRDKVKYAPSNCKYKVYIIDETHMLTTQAFNALLKTLEEPPSHVIFILATTEPHKIPLTILSRCQRFDFRKISESAIVERLSEVVAKENILISMDALKLIAYLSDGGMRDALSLLDQVSSYISDEITPKDIYNITGTATKDAVENVIKAVLSKDKTMILKEVSSLNKQGKDLIKLCDSLIVYMRDAMVSANGIKDDLIYQNSQVFSIVSSLSIEELYEYIRYLSDILFKLKTVHNPKIYLEVSLLNLSELVKHEHNFDHINISNLDTSVLFGSESEEVTAKEILKKQGIIVNEDGDFDVIGINNQPSLSIPLVEETLNEEVLEPTPVVEESSVEDVALIDNVLENNEVEDLDYNSPITEESSPIVEDDFEEQEENESLDYNSPIIEASAPFIEEHEEIDDESLVEELEDDEVVLGRSIEEEFETPSPISFGGLIKEEEIVEETSVDDYDEYRSKTFDDLENKELDDIQDDITEEFEVEENVDVMTGGSLTPQDFMDEEEVITEDMKKKYYNYLRGVRINNSLANAKKEILNELKQKWEHIEDHHVSGDKAYLFNIIVDSKLRASSEDHLIISVPTEMTVIKVMNNLDDFEKIIRDIVGVKLNITAVSEVEWARIKEDYIKKMKSGQQYNILSEQSLNEYYGVKDQRSKLLEKAQNYFGEDGLIVED